MIRTEADTITPMVFLRSALDRGNFGLYNRFYEKSPVRSPVFATH